MPNDMRAVTAETMNKLMTRDRYGRTCFHIAAHGTNPRIIDILLLISRLYYGELNYREITKLKEVSQSFCVPYLSGAQEVLT